MIGLSPRQRDLQEQEKRILEVARGILLEKGYYGTTIDGIAQEADCPKATVYRQFSCKEDIIITLALECVRRRMEMLRRGVAYKGPSRVRLVAIGEAASLFARLNPNDSSIVHLTMGPLREKGSRHRVSAIKDAELVMVGHVQALVQQAIVDGGLKLSGTGTAEQLTYGFLSMVEGAYTLMEAGVPQYSLGIENHV
jgi:AcrR family transcriptional regulator